jgi:hypothetical protein
VEQHKGDDSNVHAVGSQAESLYVHEQQWTRMFLFSQPQHPFRAVDAEDAGFESCRLESWQQSACASTYIDHHLSSRQWEPAEQTFSDRPNDRAPI